VATDLASKKVSWLQYSLAYEISAYWGQVVETQAGPADWSRVPAGQAPGATPLPKVSVSHVAVTDSSISFTVSRTGVPVEVRDSYFPGWQVHGASGPYRAMPDFMVVIPTSSRVTMVYTTTAVITTAHVLGLAGLLGVIVLAITERRRRRAASERAAAAPAHPVPAGRKVS
jgi:hypothetical protein